MCEQYHILWNCSIQVLPPVVVEHFSATYIAEGITPIPDVEVLTAAVLTVIM